MEIKTAEFVASFPRESLCPTDGRPEFAFIGRSNVGKSSLINMLTRKGMAKVSATPGKTQLLNFFLINDTWYLVDLPGYGYAKLSKYQRASLSKMIEGYLLKRQTLALAFVLIDATLPPQPIDLEFINRLGELQIPFALAFTKTDRIGTTKLEENVAQFMQALSPSWPTLPPYFITSSERRVGKEALLDYIALGLRNS